MTAMVAQPRPQQAAVSYSQLSQEQKARVAFFRFGLGPKPGAMKKLKTSTNPDAAKDLCLAELADPKTALITNPRVMRGNFDYTALRGQGTADSATGRMLDPATGKTDEYATLCAAGGNGAISAAVREAELCDRYCQHLKPEVGFVERLVLFFANHFSMYTDKQEIVRATMGHFERRIIRPYVLYGFRGMLRNAIMHPAMLIFLDNDKNRKGAINENLAREILELYSIGTGPDPAKPNFTQADVLALANTLAGWNIYWSKAPVTKPRDPSVPGSANGNGQFCFYPNAAVTEVQTLLGRTIADAGTVKAGMNAVNFLAWRDETAAHLARKLLVHFVMDDPTESMVSRITAALTSTANPSRGKLDLLAAARALLELDEAWTQPLDRIRTPNLWFISIARAMGFTDADFENGRIQAIHYARLKDMNHAQWWYLTPDGYPDRNDYWMTPNAIRVSQNVANFVIAHHQKLKGGLLSSTDPARLADDLCIAMPPLAAPGNDYGYRMQLVNLFVSPDFMCR